MSLSSSKQQVSIEAKVDHEDVLPLNNSFRAADNRHGETTGRRQSVAATRKAIPPTRSPGHPLASSVRNLQELYTVAVGVALVKAMEVFLGPHGEVAGGTSSPRLMHVPGLVVFAAILVPFYHGAMRHLDKIYIEDGARNVRQGALLADFCWLFVEAGLLLGMAIYINDFVRMMWWLVTLLLFDSAWGFTAHFVFLRGRRHWTEFKWAMINIVTVAILVIVLKAGARLVWLLLVAVGRTVIDYVLAWSFYFPTEATGESA